MVSTTSCALFPGQYITIMSASPPSVTLPATTRTRKYGNGVSRLMFNELTLKELMHLHIKFDHAICEMADRELTESATYNEVMDLLLAVIEAIEVERLLP